MKKITIRDITIEFEETLDLEITEDKIVVKGSTPTNYPVYIQQPIYPTNPWITWTLPNYVPNTVPYPSYFGSQSDPNWLGYQPRTPEQYPLADNYLGSNQNQDCSQQMFSNQ